MVIKDSIPTPGTIRRVDEPGSLLGFNQWNDVEGALRRFLVGGPLHWLGAVDIGPRGGAHQSADSLRITSQGAAWIRQQPLTQAPPPPAPIRVEADFSVSVPHSAPAFDRFRVARFTQWEASQPDFRYRITQTALRRAAAAGVAGHRVLAFLRYVTQGRLPGNVVRALEKL